MSCNLIDTSLLQDFIEGNLDSLERTFVEAHLNICAHCRKEAADIKLIMWDLSDKSNYDVEYPQELNSLGIELIDKLAKDNRRTTTKVWDAQKQNFKNSSSFIKYLPGAKQAPKFLKKASNGIKEGAKALIAK